MRSDTSFGCSLLRPFGAAALHNGTLRIIRQGGEDGREAAITPNKRPNSNYSTGSICFTPRLRRAGSQEWQPSPSRLGGGAVPVQRAAAKLRNRCPVFWRVEPVAAGDAPYSGGG